MAGRKRDVILYELNEVPWSIVDYYVQRRPNSNLAALLDGGQSLTTRHSDDPKLQGLQPWRTWPSLHNSTYDHNSFDLGQDPGTFRGDPIWDVAERAGLSVGLFGPLQSWPARQFRHGGFYVPDTFSQDAKTYPASLRSFQAFNLAMTGQNGFTSDAALNPQALLKTGVDLLRQGLTGTSAATLAGHLVREVRDERYKQLRASMQVLPSFDLYWRLHRKHQPNLSIFFTNHVASMMHRFWGDAIPGYTDEHDYVADDVYGSFIMTAMDFTDRQLGRIRKYLTSNSDSMLVLAASMGQGPVDPRFTDIGLFVLEEHAKLVSRLGLPPAEPGLTMYPHLSLVFADEAAAQAAVAPLESVVVENLGPLFARFRVEGRTVTFAIANVIDDPEERPESSISVHLKPVGSESEITVMPSDLGFTLKSRVGGDNTAYHIPEGIMLAYGAGVPCDPSRKEVDVLDVAPSLLANVLGVEPADSMRGVPSLFEQVPAAR
ncbi:hypothetical protein [Mycobacterium sp. ACS1612]|uniref:hypothetical protein n=1 Tax=Mycobacterium sp. ACS1612 TaxID=1834117 RepID=UPI000B00F1E0|nr:hypothetical protein [Mycobacterium sp. ACS1612]